MKNPREFYHKLKERDPDMITKMVKSTLHAIKNKKPKIEVAKSKTKAKLPFPK